MSMPLNPPVDPSPRYHFQGSFEEETPSPKSSGEEMSPSHKPKVTEEQQQRAAGLQEKSTNIKQENDEEEDLPDNLSAFMQSPEGRRSMMMTPSPASTKKPAGSPPSSNNSRRSSSSYLTRKAQRFSSIKKKKGLLGKILCNSPGVKNRIVQSDPDLSKESEIEVLFTERDDSTSSASSDENRIPHLFSPVNSSPKSGTCTSPKASPILEALRSSPCGELSSALENASEQLILHDEEKVRLAVQETLKEAMLEACTAPKSDVPSPKSMRISGSSLLDNDEDSDGGSEDMLKSENSIEVDEDGPREGESKIASVIRKFQSPPHSTPKKDYKPMRTPGGLVIPTPFQCASAKSLFPSTTLDRVFCRVGEHKSPTRERTSTSTGKEFKNDNIASSTFGESLASSSSSSSSWSYSNSATPKSSKAPVDDDADITEPIQMVRMVSSLEDLATVKEASTSKETASLVERQATAPDDEVDDDDDAFLPDDFKASLMNKKSSTADATPKIKLSTSSPRHSKGDLERCVAEAVSKAKGEWQASFEKELRAKVEQENERKLETAMAEYKAEGEKLLDEHGRQRQREFEEEMKSIRENYERKLAEQKDKVAMAHRIANVRQTELERLEASETEFEKQKKEVEQFKLKKEQQYEKLRSELEEMKTRVKSTADVEKLEKELKDAKAKLSAKEKKAADASNNETNPLQEELQKVQAELASAKDSMKQASVSEDKADRLEEELKLVRQQLSAKEKELFDLNKCTNTPSRRASLGTPSSKTPIRLQKPSPSKRMVGSGNRDGGALELYEKEKESLRQQIVLLEEQGAKANKEHEHALMELRKASEAEIVNVRKQLEERLQVHIDKERELKETLSEVGSNEKEELLEQIERLQNEKQAERAGGLREVQKKEDLLQRISALEKNEKDLAEEHERTLNEIRQANEAEIKQLRKEMEIQEEQRFAKENELRRAISETSSFEKEELMHKIEKLQTELESEKSGAVLVKMRVTTVEKEAENALRAHEEAIQELEATKNEEIEKLKKELDGLSMAKKELEKNIAEHDGLKKQLDEAKSALEEAKSDLTKQLDNLRKKHADELSVLKKEAEDNLVLVQTESQDTVESLQKQSEERYEEMKKELGEKIVTLNKEIAVKETQWKDNYELKSKQSMEEARELKDQITSLKKLSEEAKAVYEKRIKELANEHHKELDDLLSQLDLVEAEHKQKLAEKEKSLAEKDAIVAALGTQLADAQTKAKSCQELQTKAMSDLELFRERNAETQRALETCRNELEKARSVHEKFVKTAEHEKEKACEEAREEMIERAEAQFQQANDVYVKLKKQYDSMRLKVENLEKELKKSQCEVDRVTKEMEKREVDLKAEAAQLKVEKATVEADSAQKAKEYRREMERLLNAAKDFETKCQEAEESSQSIQKTLATVVAEKEQLKIEYDELNKVCEELMAHVESQGQHEC